MFKKSRPIPIWTDQHGKHYYSFEEIGDAHLLNIVWRLERKGIPVPREFYKELDRRGLDWDEEPIRELDPCFNLEDMQLA
jgi:hypothetical protein